MAALLLIYSYSWVLAYHETFDPSNTRLPRLYLIFSSVIAGCFFLYSLCMRIAIRFVDPFDLSLFFNGLLCAAFATVLVIYSVLTHHALRLMISSPKVVLAKRNAFWMVISLAILFVAFLGRFVTMSILQFSLTSLLESNPSLFEVLFVIFPTTILWLVLVTLVFLTVRSSSSSLFLSSSDSRGLLNDSEVSLLDEAQKTPKIYDI